MPSEAGRTTFFCKNDTDMLRRMITDEFTDDGTESEFNELTAEIYTRQLENNQRLRDDLMNAPGQRCIRMSGTMSIFLHGVEAR